MTVLILDTNWWIYLANSKDPDSGNFQENRHILLLEKMTQMMRRGNVQLLTSEIVLQEWGRNKANTREFIDKLNRRMEDQLKGIENLRELTRGKVNNEIDIIKVEVEAQYKELIRRNEAHIVEVEALLAAARKYEITRDVYARVAEWAVAKKAPFIGDKKNSAADAAILFGAVDFVQENRWSGDFLLGDSLFVSANKGDFSSKTNPDKIHEDLAPMLEAVSMGYARSLPAALAKVDETVFRENEIREMEADMDDYLGEVECSACEANEYNRYDNYVILADVEITGVKEEGNDEDQLELEFKDMQNEDKKAMRIRVGWCPSCGTMHIECPCGEVISLEGVGDDEIVECDNCSQKFKLYVDDDGSGYGGERIHFVI